jgi:hypothetical protein
MIIIIIIRLIIIIIRSNRHHHHHGIIRITTHFFTLIDRDPAFLLLQLGQPGLYFPPLDGRLQLSCGL